MILVNANGHPILDTNFQNKFHMSFPIQLNDNKLISSL